MKKIATNFIIAQYQSGIKSYRDFTTKVGLWASELYVFEKYIQKTDTILDLGCGTGRTTFALFQSGYQNIRGIDLTPEMIDAAQSLNTHFDTNIDFAVGDARNLPFENAAFEVVVFSFNGMMSIPNSKERLKVLHEVYRVLKPEGIFIFTTHDRDEDPTYFDFWKKEKQKWDAGRQRKDLYEFGDLITTSKNESREIFIHIPDKAEMIDFIKEGGFEVVETFYRNEKFEESAKVKEKSGECRFWVVKK